MLTQSIVLPTLCYLLIPPLMYLYMYLYMYGVCICICGVCVYGVFFDVVCVSICGSQRRRERSCFPFDVLLWGEDHSPSCVIGESTQQRTQQRTRRGGAGGWCGCRGWRGWWWGGWAATCDTACDVPPCHLFIHLPCKSDKRQREKRQKRDREGTTPSEKR